MARYSPLLTTVADVLSSQDGLLEMNYLVRKDQQAIVRSLIDNTWITFSYNVK